MARQLRPAGWLLLVTLATCACEAPGPPPAAGPATPVGSDVTASAAGSSPAPSPSSPSPPAVTVTTLSGSAPDSAAAYRYQVAYPQIQGTDSRAQGIDSAIQGTLQRDVDDFIDGARAAPAGPTPSELDCRSRTVRLTARLVVARVDCTQHTAGAAHPTTFTHTFNCDLAGGRVLALQDLFSAGSAYLTVISDAARMQLSQLQGTDQSTLAAGTAPVVANFRDFLLEQDALVVVFARYQVAGGAAGGPEASVPYSALARYLAPGIPQLVA